jgi:hypothetical protein
MTSSAETFFVNTRKLLLVHRLLTSNIREVCCCCGLSKGKIIVKSEGKCNPSSLCSGSVAMGCYIIIMRLSMVIREVDR